jgi:hypothetical protein
MAHHALSGRKFWRLLGVHAARGGGDRILRAREWLAAEHEQLQDALR